MIFQSTYSSSGPLVTGTSCSSLGHQAGTPRCTGCPSITGCTRTHAHTHRGQDILGMREETRKLEKTHVDMGKMCKLRTDSGPRWESNISLHQSYKEMTLFEGLLYILLFLLYIFFFGKFFYSHSLCNSSGKMTHQARVLPELQSKFLNSCITSSC